MEEDNFVTKHITNTEPLNKVTKVSRYLTAVIFVTLPFIGAYVGYQYAPVSYTDNLVILKVQDQAIKAEPERANEFSCDHRHLHKDHISVPTDWVDYYNEEFDFGFSHPPDKAPNYEHKGVEGTIEIGYEPGLDPKEIEKEAFRKGPYEGGWNVYVYQATTTKWEGYSIKPDQPETYCELSAWCRKDRISIESSDLTGYVVSVEEHAVGNPASRTYYLNRADLKFRLYNGDSQNYIEGYPCSYIVGAYEIDMIAQSLY